MSVGKERKQNKTNIKRKERKKKTDEQCKRKKERK